MSDFSIGLICLAIALVTTLFKKAYNYLPDVELKRRAEHHDSLSVSLYRAVSYGPSLRLLLWLLLSFSTSAAIILLTKQLALATAIFLTGLIIWVLFGCLPSTKTGRLSLTLARLLSPAVVWLTGLLHPILSRWVKLGERWIGETPTQLFEKADLKKLVSLQSKQSDSRLTKADIGLISRALKFDELSVADVMRPRDKVKTLLAKATIGPVLINELHESKQDFALVKQTNKGDVVGRLAFKDLGIESRGKVADLMDSRLYYLNQNDSLSVALEAFFATNQPVFIVVNDFEEQLGIVAVKDVIEKLIGKSKPDGFDQYDSARAVAARYSETQAEPTVQEKTEVVE